MEKSKLVNFIKLNITAFHESRLESLKGLKLSRVLERKNPYLYKAKNINTCESLIKTVVDAHLSSQEETIFGEFLEKLAIFVCGETMGGYKSGIEGIDLEIDMNNIRYIIAIKSGPNWGNSSQIKKMKTDFAKAIKTIRTQNSSAHILAINGCCYGRCAKPDKGEYFKYCGQKFWEFITGNEDFYIDIIEPLGHKAKRHNDAFCREYDKIVNIFTKAFIADYCLEDGSINWDKIVKMNSAIKNDAK